MEVRMEGEEEKGIWGCRLGAVGVGMGGLD